MCIRDRGDLALMRRIDELHLNHPFAGARMLRDFLGLAGFQRLLGGFPLLNVMPPERNLFYCVPSFL